MRLATFARNLACFISAAALTATFGNAHGKEPVSNTKPLRIALDIGHSKKRFGATSARGRREYDFNRRFVLELFTMAKKRPLIDFFIINLPGTDIALRERTRIASLGKADLFLSIHHDSVNEKYLRTWQYGGKERIYSDAFRGHSLFVSSENPEFDASFAAAKMIGRHMRAIELVPTLHHAEPIKGENRKLLSKHLGVYDVPFAVLRHARSPSVLFEVGVIIHRDEEALLDKRAYRRKIQVALLAALEEYRAKQHMRAHSAKPAQ